MALADELPPERVGECGDEPDDEKVNPRTDSVRGAGPGDPDLLTVRARSVLCSATTAFIDPDVPPGVVELIGSVHRPRPPTTGAPKPVDPKRSTRPTTSMPNPRRRIGRAPGARRPADGAKDPRRNREDRDRRRARRRWRSADLRGPGRGRRCRTYLGGLPRSYPACLPPGRAQLRRHAARLGLHGLPMCAATSIGRRRWPLRPVRWSCTARPASRPAAASLIDNGLPPPPRWPSPSTATCAQRTIEATLETAADSGRRLLGPLLVTIGVSQPRQALLVGRRAPSTAGRFSCRAPGSRPVR